MISNVTPLFRSQDSLRASNRRAGPSIMFSYNDYDGGTHLERGESSPLISYDATRNNAMITMEVSITQQRSGTLALIEYMDIQGFELVTLCPTPERNLISIFAVFRKKAV
jgi:hypothetical protein